MRKLSEVLMERADDSVCDYCRGDSLSDGCECCRPDRSEELNEALCIRNAEREDREE